MPQKRKEDVALASLTPLAKNPRKHTEKQITELMKAVKQFGQTRPLVIDEDGTILAGNGLYIALTKMGWETAEAYRMIGLSKSDRTKLVLSDNRIGELSHTDFTVLEEILVDLDDLDVAGYEADTLAGILMSTETAAAEAAQYGVLDQDTKERLAHNAERLDAAAEAAVQQRPAPPHRGGGGGGGGTGTSGDEATETNERGDYCPTCHRPW